MFNRSGINATYGKTARFDTGRALTEDEMRASCPSVFATEAHSSRSDRFRPIPTIEIVRGLAKEGFSCVNAVQQLSRTDGRTNYTKHLLRFRRLQDQEGHKVGDTICEMLLKNANDGSSVYDLMAGLFRSTCLNSMVVQSSSIDSIKVRHSGDAMGKVIEGTYRVCTEAQKALVAPREWTGITLDSDERNAFAEAAHIVRFADAEGNVETPIRPAQLLYPRRVDDNARNLWTTFNVVQENVIRGGLTAMGRNHETNRPRRTTTRQINGIDQDVKLNKALWVLAEKMAALKGVAVAA